MIVRLQRPSPPAPAGAPWLLYSEDGTVADCIAPTPALEAVMPEACAWFEAQPLEAGGWEIGRRLDAGAA